MPAGDLGMFGTPIGDYRATENRYRLGEIAMQPAQARRLTAEAGLLESQLQEEKLFLNAMGRMASEAPTGSDGKPQSLSEMYDDLARLAAPAGFTKKAQDLAKTAGYIKTHEAAADYRKAQQRVSELKAQEAKADVIGRLMDNVTDEVSWNRANLLYQVELQEPSPFVGLPYNKDLTERIKSAALSRKDQVGARLREEENNSRERARVALRNHYSTLEAQGERRTQAAESREDRLAKGGGGRAVTSPSKSEVDQAMRLVKREYAKLPDSDYLNAAFEIASEARALRNANRALNADEALQQAYIAAKARGEFKEIVEKGILRDTKKQMFSGGGRSPTTALALPSDPKALIKGRYYTGAKGVGKWTGTGFEPVGGGSPLSGDKSDLGDETDDEEE